MWIDLAILKITGKDAFDFLQGLLTTDMQKVVDAPQKGALCNNQGRVIASFDIQKTIDGYELLLPKLNADKTLKSLQKYARFSNVQLGVIATTKQLDLLESIQKKIAVILPETSEKFTPHELNYQHLQFISFDKGCYVGQEIIARMHYLGKLKKQLQHITSLTKQGASSESETLVNIAFNPTTNFYEMLVVKKITP